MVKDYIELRTKTHIFTQLTFQEIKELKCGDKIAICINWNAPKTAEFVDATVTRPLFWNSDVDEPGWEIETSNGFADTNSVYKVEER